MEAICEKLSGTVSEQEFLQNTRILLSILHNLLQEPHNDGHRKLRASSKFFTRPGISEVIDFVGFTLKDGCYMLPEGEDKSKNVRLVMKEVVARRKSTGNPLGWDVPTSALQFTKVIGSGRYGDIFNGQLDGQEVAIKTLRPDASSSAKESFRRELGILSNLSHPHVIHLVGATLLSEPASIIVELLPHSMLHFLHHGELCDVEIFRYSRQVAVGMEYLHSKGILHCDLAARNLLMSMEGEVKLSDFSLSCKETEPKLLSCVEGGASMRWAAPEVLMNSVPTKQSDVWSYGVLIYEFVTGGSVPYANFSNNEARTKVLEGYRLSQPHCCLDEFYSLMMKCWSTSPEVRPSFREILMLLLNPMETMLASTSDERPLRHNRLIMEESSPNERKALKKCKIKEPNYSAVMGKGGGLLRIYTALVNSFQPRVIMVCGKKTTMAEVVQLALAKCGKGDLDHRSYAIALLDEAHQPIKYLGPDDKAISVKSSVSPNAQFVLCIRTPEKSLLDVIASIKQNPAYRNALDTRTRGYLVKSNPIAAVKSGSLKPKNCSGWQRYWCLLDGSTLVFYTNEEDEGMKQFEQYLDFRGASVTILTEKNGNHFRVDLLEGSCETYVFSANERQDTLRWVEAIEGCVDLDPSAALLQATGGAILHTGFLTCHKFCNTGSENFDPLQPMAKIKLGDAIQLKDNPYPVNYGKLWSVVKQSGEIQCMVQGKPELLLTLKDCVSVRVQNPPIMREGSDFCIKMYTKESAIFVLRAELPTDHYDWMLAMERILQESGRSAILIRDQNRESGYVTLKRLMSLQHNEGIRGSQLISPQAELEALQDLYDNALCMHNRASPDGCEEKLILELPEGPPVPPRGSSAPPPPIPPKDPPPLPPKRGNSLQRVRTPSIASTVSNGSNHSGDFDEYISMQPTMQPVVPTSLKLTSPVHSSQHSNISNCSIPSPITEGDDYMTMKPAMNGVDSARKENMGPPPSQPISIPTPLRRISSGKRSILLRSTSDSDSSVTVEVTPPLPPRGPSPRHHHVTSLSNSLTRHPSGSSINSVSSSSSSLIQRDRFYNSVTSDPPPRGRVPMLIPRSNSITVQPVSPVKMRLADVSQSEGMAVKEARERYLQYQQQDGFMSRSYVGSVSSVLSSENGLDISGLSSCSSSVEDMSQSQPALPTGWEKGYCNQSQKTFYFNSELNTSTWEYEEVLMYGKNGAKALEPGKGWHSVKMNDGRIYYYNEETRITTWNVSDTRQ